MKWLGVMMMALAIGGCASPYIGSTRSPSSRQYINLYDNAGNRKAYGTVTEGGYIQLFSPSGERVQWGRVK